MKIYFDNYFTGLPLINKLFSMKCDAIGTICGHRISKSCPIRDSHIIKKSKRGSTDMVVDTKNKISIVRPEPNSKCEQVVNQREIEDTNFSTKCIANLQDFYGENGPKLQLL